MNAPGSSASHAPSSPLHVLTTLTCRAHRRRVGGTHCSQQARKSGCCWLGTTRRSIQMAISAPTGAPSSEFWLDRVLAGLPKVQERVVTRRACMVHAWLVVCTRTGSRRRSSFRPRFAASPAHPGGCPTCAGRAAAVRPALRGHAGLWAGLAAKPAPFVWATLGLYASEQGGAKRGQVPRANKGWVAPQTEWGGGNHGSSQPGGLDPSAGFCQVSQGRPSTAATTELTRY